jgi:hypothetical protein
MKRTAIVHIGLEKTGSTAIQKWLAANHGLLQENGILMPKSIGYPNHTKLVAACLDEGVVDNIKSYHLFVAGLSEQGFRSRVFAELQREIVAAPAGWHMLLITSELISSRLSSPAEIQRLLTQVQPYVDHVHFVVFLRRQDQLALSRFSSILRSGHAGFDDLFVNYSPSNFLRLPDGREISDDLFFYDFERILERFEGLPSTSIDVNVYGCCNPVGVLAEMLQLDARSDVIQRERHNSALSADAQYILSQLNAIVPVQFPSGMRNDAYRKLQRRVEAEVLGESRAVSRPLAHEFFDRYAATNQRIFSRYVKHGERFSDDFSAYPEVVDYSQLPDRVADRLGSYREQAQRLPRVEPMSMLLKYQLKRAKTSLKTALRRSRLLVGSDGFSAIPPGREEIL